MTMRRKAAKGARSARPKLDEPIAKPAPSAVDLAYRAIKADILSNRLRPGDAVPVERYVKDLNLSRTPVREATLRLEREGLIDIRARLGTFVSYLDLRNIRDMYRVRRLLEGEAAREAATPSAVPSICRSRATCSALSSTTNTLFGCSVMRQKV